MSDLQLLDGLGGLSRIFTPVTAKKVADALGRRAAAGAQQQQQGQQKMVDELFCDEQTSNKSSKPRVSGGLVVGES